MWKAEPTPHTPLSPFPGGEWGRGVRAGAHTPLPGNLFIYSIYSKEHRTAVFWKMGYFKTFILKRAPHCGVVERGRVGCGPQCLVLENEAFLNIYILKKVPHWHVLENRLGFRLCTYLTFLRVIRSEFKA